MTVGNYLIEIARARKLVDYQTICAAFNFSMELTPWQEHPLCEILDSIDQDDANHNRPFRTALVISKKTKMPGNGFYDALERYKGIESRNEMSKLENWSQQVEATYQYPWA